jgi:hypothetical protein
MWRSATVMAEEAATVQSLIKQGFAIVGTFQIPTGGAGLLQQNKEWWPLAVRFQSGRVW